MVIDTDERTIIHPSTVLGDGFIDNDAVLNATTIDAHFSNDERGKFKN
jgi:hypothetical protein